MLSKEVSAYSALICENLELPLKIASQTELLKSADKLTICYHLSRESNIISLAKKKKTSQKSKYKVCPFKIKQKLYLIMRSSNSLLFRMWNEFLHLPTQPLTYPVPQTSQNLHQLGEEMHIFPHLESVVCTSDTL